MPPSTPDCFELAERVEVLFRELYVTLAHHPATPRPLAEFFLHMAREEEQHAERVRLLGRAPMAAAWSPDAMREIAGDLQLAVREMEVLLREIGGRHGPGELPDVIARLAGLEERFAFVHAESLSRSGDRGVAILFESLSRQDARHVDLLRRAQAGALAAPEGAATSST